jgi:hypothetical protein
MNQLLRKYRSALAYLSLIVISLAALLFATNIVRGFSNPTQQPPHGQPTAIPVNVGGTGSTTAADVRVNLGIAAAGANSDITSLSPTGGVLTVDSLKTNGALQLLVTSTAPIACGASSKASLYFNSVDKKVYYCNGSAWKPI